MLSHFMCHPPLRKITIITFNLRFVFRELADVRECVDDNTHDCDGAVTLGLRVAFNVTLGLVGDRCPDPCLNNPCEHGGVCVQEDLSLDYECHCADGWMGDLCERGIN